MVDYDYSRNLHSLSGPASVVSLLIGKYPEVRSFLDVGCGTGAWGRALLEHGITDYLGIDGSDHPDTAMHIPRDMFQRHDLEKQLDLGRRFDAALCLEVAEHLPEVSAGVLLESLTKHADLVIFSAAAPGQRGQGHVNCWFPSYWQAIFNSFGFECSDALRWQIWDNAEIEPWYRQNIFVARRDPSSAGREERIRSVRHPDLDPMTKFPKRVAQSQPQANVTIGKKSKPASWPSRVIFFQNGLFNASGHWLTETWAWRTEVLSLGIEWHGFSHVLFGKRAKEMDLVPAIPFLPGQSRRGFSRKARLAAYLDGAILLPDILERHWPGEVGPDDLLYVAYTTDVEMIGIARWLEEIPEAKRPMVAFFFHHPAHEWSVDFQRSGLRGDFLRYLHAVERIRGLNVRCRIFASGDLLSKTLGSVLKYPVEDLNFVSHYPEGFRQEDCTCEYDIGLLGGGREEQGRKGWPLVLRELLTKIPSLRICVQIPSAAGESKIPDDLKPFVSRSGVTFFHGNSRHLDHFRRIASCKTLLLPYSPQIYALRSSGVFQEACILGVPTVVPRKTSIGRMIQSGKAAGVVYGGDDPADIALAVEQALERHESLVEQAQALKEVWRRETSIHSVFARMKECFLDNAVHARNHPQT